MAEFKDRFKALRLEKGLTQDEIAARLDLTKTAVSSYERGKNKPRFEMLDTMADLFDVNIDYLSGSSDTRRPYPRIAPEEEDKLGADLINVDIDIEEYDLVKAYRRLDEYAKRIIRMTAHLEE